MASQRQLRVGEMLKHSIARNIGQITKHDDTLSSCIITITEVKVSPDLLNCSVFFNFHSNNENHTAELIESSLRDHGHRFRKFVGGNLVLKFVPKINFYYDDSVDNASYINDLMSNPKVRKDLDENQTDEAIQEIQEVV